MAFEPVHQKKVYTDPTNAIQVYKLEYIPEFDKIDYDVDDSSEIDKFIKDCEKMVRNSFEYQRLIQYIRTYMNMNHCSFWRGVSNVDTSAIKIHLHHSPITLYEIVATVLEKRKFFHESVLIEDVAQEACYVHYCLLIGLIPLCETVHTLVHNEYVFVPNTAVFGNYNEFIQLYGKWIPDEVRDKLDRIEEYSKAYNEAENLAILQPNYIHIDYVGDFDFPTTEEMLNLLDNRMKLLQSHGYSMEQVPLIRFISEEELNSVLEKQMNEYIDEFVDYKPIEEDDDSEDEPIPLIKFISNN